MGSIFKNQKLIRRMAGILLTAAVSFSAVPVQAGAAEKTNAPEKLKCTGIFIGKDVSAEGTRIIARSEDQDVSLYPKMFTVIPAGIQYGGQLVDTGKNQNGFSVEIPEKTFKITAIPDASVHQDGDFFAACMNEKGVGVTATVTTYINKEYEQIDPCRPAGTGIREAIIPEFVALQAESARHGAELLAQYVDRYGSEETGTTMFCDQKEAWILEIYGGTTYAAMRMPEDKVAVFGNEVMIGWTDLRETESFFCSKNLRECIGKMEKPVTNGQGQVNLAMTIGKYPFLEKSHMRTWRGHELFAPGSVQDYSETEYHELFFTPDHPVSLQEIIAVYQDEYNGTPYDLNLPGNREVYRAVGTNSQSDVHIIQVFDDLPADCCMLQWLCMGDSMYSVFVPAFSGITSTYEKYRVDTPDEKVMNDSFYMLCRQINTLAETDREGMGMGVKAYNLSQEMKMMEKVKEALPTIRTLYSSEAGMDAGRKFVTELAEQMAKEQYENAQIVRDRLFLTKMYNDFPFRLDSREFTMD